MVALICELLALRGDERVLDVGTGSGYQAAVLAELAREVHTIERLPELADAGAREPRRRPATRNASSCTSATARSAIPSTRRSPRSPSPPRRPTPPSTLYEQLEPGGRLVLPVGNRHDQLLELVVRRPEGPVVPAPSRAASSRSSASEGFSGG